MNAPIYRLAVGSVRVDELKRKNIFKRIYGFIAERIEDLAFYIKNKNAEEEKKYLQEVELLREGMLKKEKEKRCKKDLR